jgi:hypothetical protein
MTLERWTFARTDELKAQLRDIDPVLAHQVDRDIDKLVTRGIQNVGEPLVGHLEGDIYYVRSMVRGCGWFRTFYFRNGLTSLLGFYGFFKTSDRLPGRVKKVILERHEQYKNRRKK